MRRFSSLFACAAIVVWMALAPQPVQAEATFLLGFSGPGQYTPSGFPECPPENPFCTPQPITWAGTITLVTSDGADGTYTGPSLLALSIDSNLFTASANGPVSGVFVSVTLENDQVSSFDSAFATVANIPEPETLPLMLLGLLVADVVRRSRRFGKRARVRAFRGWGG